MHAVLAIPKEAEWRHIPLLDPFLAALWTGESLRLGHPIALAFTNAHGTPLRSDAFAMLIVAVVGFDDLAQRHWRNAVATHADLGRLRQQPAGGRSVDDIARREVLSVVELSREQHAQPDVDDHSRFAAQPHGHQGQSVSGGDGCGRIVEI